jgi:hypothetical protein
VPCRLDGRPLLSVFFAVEHKQDADRLVLDRRPANSGERRLEWSLLPYGPQLARVCLRLDQAIRGSGDDLRTYFHQLKNSDQAIWRNVLGKQFSGAGWESFGADPHKQYRLALRVAAMGDLNAVCSGDPQAHS